jgi:hypothetical protein
VDDREFLNRVAVLCHRKQIGQLSRINLVALVPLFQQGILARIARSLKLLSNSCILNRNLLAGHSSKLEIQGELDLAGTGSSDRLPKSGHRR